MDLNPVGSVEDAAADETSEAGRRRRMWLCTMTSGDDEDPIPFKKEVEEEDEKEEDENLEVATGKRASEIRGRFLIGSSSCGEEEDD